MKKPFLSLCILVSGTLSFAPASFAQPAPPPSNQVVIGHTDTIRSQLFNETRRYWVSVPPKRIYAQQKYPLLLLLDGNAHFGLANSTLEVLSPNANNMLMPEMVIVGIGYPDRNRDLTPSQMKEFMGDSMAFRTSGGLVKFTDFLEQELIPHLEAKYPIAPYRTYFGHSLGGLAVLHTLFDRPQLFNNYIAIDPSLWWDNELVLKLAKQKIETGNYSGKAAYVALANNFPVNMSMEPALNDSSIFSQMNNPNHNFCHWLEKQQSDGFRFSWKYYPDEDHSTIPLVASNDGLRAVFHWHNIKKSDLNTITNPFSKVTIEQWKQNIERHFKNISTHLGYEVPPYERLINTNGYQTMRFNKLEFSKVLFEMNVANFPQSANAYDGMGDYYMRVGDKEAAKTYFTKAVELGATNANVINRKLAALQ